MRELTTTLYIGITSNLVQRIYQHNHKRLEGFSAKYNLHKLVYFEQFERLEEAIMREKRLKLWKRDWKNRIINEMNPEWKDLYSGLLG